MPVINSFTNWSKLEEVWLGDCYPAHFYDHLEPEVRDIFYEITEKTQQDLAVIQNKLQEFGVKVRRPEYNHIDNYLRVDQTDALGQLRKPMICPRDYFLVYGNTFYGHARDYKPWADAMTEYAQDPDSCIIQQHPGRVGVSINGANTVRAGRDIYLDSYHSGGLQTIENTNYQSLVQDLFGDYRVHQLHNGGHVDGCFAAIKPGLLITCAYFSNYDGTFPGWEKIDIRNPEFRDHMTHRQSPLLNGKWWMPGISESAKFNEHIINHARDWIGDYTETYFEVNCLVIDEHNVLMVGENEAVFRELEKYGVTAHPMPFRTRTFWDGGLHCITLDIRRQDTKIDLFPDRGDQKLFVY